MKLTEKLEFKQVLLQGMAVKPTAAEPFVILALEAEVTPEISQILGCEEAIFANDGILRSGVKVMELDTSIDEFRATFHSAKEDGQTIICHPESIEHLKVVREMGEPLLRFRVKIAGYATAFCDLINETRDQKFTIALEPSQIALDFSGENSKADGPADEAFLESLGITEPTVEVEAPLPPPVPEPPKKRGRKAKAGE